MKLTVEERLARAEKWAEATGSAPGYPEYREAFMHGFFNVSQTSAKGLDGAILETFAELERERDEAVAGAYEAAKKCVWSDWNAPIGDLSSVYVTAEISDRIEKLTPADALKARDLLVAKAKRDALISLEDAAAMISDPYKLRGLLSDHRLTAQAEVTRLTPGGK